MVKIIRLANFLPAMKMASNVEVLEIRRQTITVRSVLRTQHSTLPHLHA